MKAHLLLIGAVLVHTSLALYSFGVLFGIAHMHPDQRPGAVLWQLLVTVTWFPLLMLASYVRVAGERVVEPWSVPLALANSTLVVYGVWFAVRALRRRRSCRQ